MDCQTLETLIIDTNIRKSAKHLPIYDQKGCPVAAILDLMEAFISQSASFDFIK